MPTVSVESRASYGELVKGVGVQFLDVFNQSSNSYSLAIDNMLAQEGNKLTSLAKNVTTPDSIVHFQQKTGTNYLSITGEGEAFASDSRLLGYKTSVAPQKFTSSVSVTYEALMDREYKQALDEFGDLTISAKETMDKTFFDMFNYAFTAQTSLPISIVGYGDSKPLCSTLHPRKDGGAVQSNASATGVTLTETNLNTARTALLRQLDDRGKPTRVGGGKLILLVPSELEKDAVIFTKSEKRSGTANNDINIYDGLMTVIASKYISSTTAWFLIDPRNSKLMFILREGIGTHKYEDPNTLSNTFYVRSRYAVCWADWRGVWGSKGDAASYAL